MGSRFSLLGICRNSVQWSRMAIQPPDIPCGPCMALGPTSGCQMCWIEESGFITISINSCDMYGNVCVRERCFSVCMDLNIADAFLISSLASDGGCQRWGWSASYSFSE